MKTKKTSSRKKPIARSLPKAPSGIPGLDEITRGGLPRGRPTLVCGGPGCGKTLLAMEFLCRGISQYGEPGVFMAFEEKEEDLIANFAELGLDLAAMVGENKLALDYVYIERSEIEETGEYDLEGLFVRLAAAVESVGAKRVVLDTVEALFSGFSDESVLRAELRRLFRWLKERGLTAVITGEKGDSLLTRHGLEEYVADCVITLDHRVNEQVATRRLKVIKYRGSGHGTNEYPFIIGENGIIVFPITSLLLDAPASRRRISSGIRELDRMLDGRGFYRGSVILVSGTAGSGKTSILARFVDSACQRGSRALFFAFEESPDQIIRNTASIGMTLDRWRTDGRLSFSAHRGTYWGLEKHLVMAHQLVREFKPSVVAIDPISSLARTASPEAAGAMLARLLDFLKAEEITVMMSDLSSYNREGDATEVGVSTLSDAWIKLEMVRENSLRHRRIGILKARGLGHSHRFRELLISAQGLAIGDIPPGKGEEIE